MLYFRHDIGASSDEKIMKLRLLHGGAAVDAYWYIIERLYKEETKLDLLGNPAETQLVSFWLNVGSDELTRWVSSMVELGLLTNDGGLWSKRVQVSLGFYRDRAQVSRENGKKGGRPPKQNPAGTQKKPTRFLEETQTEPREKPIKRKRKSNLGFDKQNLNTLDGDSVEAESRQSEAEEEEYTTPHCSFCGAVCTFKPIQGTFRCNNGTCAMTHGDMSRGQVVYR